MSKVISQNEPRMSQVLPTVKCSDCGRQVELRKLAIHLCSSVPPVPTLHKAAARVPVGHNTPPIDTRVNRPAMPYDTYTRNDSLKSPAADHRQDGYFTSDRNYGQDYQSAPRMPRKPAVNDYFGGSEVGGSPTNLMTRDQDQQRDYYGARNNSTSSSPPHRQAPRNGDYARPPTPTYNYDKYEPKTNENYRPREEPSQQSKDWFDDDQYGDFFQPTSETGGALDSLMSGLMSKMTTDNTSQPTTARSPPSYKPITGSYERDCCEHEGKLFCERDYRVVKKRVYCSECDKPISSSQKSIQALGKHYHAGHLHCAYCKHVIDQKYTGLVEHQGQVFCKEDFKQLFLPKCRACGFPVEKEAVSAMDGKLQGKWHRTCFGCQTCHNAFPDNTFYVYDGAPYCKRHYHRLNNSLCRCCDEPIEGPCVQTIEGWRYHPPCLSCSVCRRAITDVYYIHENRTYCETHMLQLQRQRNVRAERRQTMFKNL
ncbi:hypothetical protein NQZ79_g4164 [Umbelopsis isabellina]|nr:hypothetical protein NQZ79_g4164 [Umbelopsis isabellina]